MAVMILSDAKFMPYHYYVTAGEGLKLFDDVPDMELKLLEVSGNEHVAHARCEILSK